MKIEVIGLEIRPNPKSLFCKFNWVSLILHTTQTESWNSSSSPCDKQRTSTSAYFILRWKINTFLLDWPQVIRPTLDTGSTRLDFRSHQNISTIVHRVWIWGFSIGKGVLSLCCRAHPNAGVKFCPQPKSTVVDSFEEKPHCCQLTEIEFLSPSQTFSTELGYCLNKIASHLVSHACALHNYLQAVCRFDTFFGSFYSSFRPVPYS